MALVKILFLGSFLMLGYIYIGYPILVFLLSLLKNKGVRKETFQPYVTILIAAYNEEENIEETIKNKLDLNYPREKREIMVISDGSTDKTDDIVKKYDSQGIKLIRQEIRSGKTAALNKAVPQVVGDILVFSDANSIYNKNALQKLVDNFADPTVGYVTGKMIYTNPDDTAIGDGCNAYIRYENYLRKLETKLGSIVGVDGGIDAVRKTLYTPMNPDQLPDFVLPLKIVNQGFRVVFEPEAVLKESSLSKASDEYQMRVRVILRALWALWDMRYLLSFKRSGLFAWQLWSHKVLRYFCFIFLLGAYFSNLVLLSQGVFYIVIFLVQNAAYLGALVSGIVQRSGRNSGVLYILSYFVLLNVASVHAFMKFLQGQRQVTWTPRKG
jgi:cellulose synthase/poly-beta-1,6-N-acetylglucosamine synthase-like glycosyltransferase